MTFPRASRFWKGLAWAFLGFVLLGGFVGLTIWYLQTAQQRSVEAELTERGESISIRDFIPPAIADAENFFADPMWLELTEPTRLTGNASVPTKLLNRMMPTVTAEEAAALKSAWPEVPWPVDDFQNRREGLLSRVWMKFPPDASPEQRRQWAGFTLAALQPLAPLFEKLEVLGTRPQAQFPLEYERGTSMPMPHLNYLMRQGQLLSARARASIYLGESDKALADIALILRLADATKSEPFLVSFLVRCTLIRLALSSFHIGLENHAWNARQLADFEERTKTLSVLPDFFTVVRGERAHLNITIDKMFAAMHRPKTGPGTALDASEALRKMLTPVVGMANSYDLTRYNRKMQEWLDVMEATAPGEWPTKMRSPQELKKVQDPEFLQAARPVLDNYRTSIRSEARALEAEVRVRQARLACALERHWLKQGTYPAALDALVPEFLPEIPVDLVDPRPMKYRLLNPQKYRLYSIGFDRVDEAGAANASVEEGDWVWGRAKS